MKSLKHLVLALLILISSGAFSQVDSTLNEINNDIWQPFSNAYENLNYQLYESIHHKDFIRVNGNQDDIKSRGEYLSQYKQNWEDKSRNLEIQFRFLERIYSQDKASERGIYKLTINNGLNDEASYYGKFHVILTKDGAKWKLLMDYDSHEENSINETSFKNAFAMDDFSKN